MNIECFALRGQIFTHVDKDTGKNTVYAVSDIRRACDHARLELVGVPLERPVAKMIMGCRGLEDHRLIRALSTTRWLPLLFAHQQDGTDLLIDGSHSYVARTMLGHRYALAYIVPQELWAYYLVEGLPEVPEEELLASWSGVV